MERVRRVSAKDNADLFWAIRGGGGNFGVATSFEYRLHDQNPQVYAAYIAYPVAHLREVMELYEQTTSNGPRELSLDLSVEASDAGAPLVAIYACHSGDPADGPALMAPFERVAKPFQSVHGPRPTSRCSTNPTGRTSRPRVHYIKAGLVTEFEPGLDRCAAGVHSRRNELFVYMQNASGAVGDMSPTDTAFWNRKTMTNLMLLSAPGKIPRDTERNRRRRSGAAWDKIAPFTARFLHEPERCGPEEHEPELR